MKELIEAGGNVNEHDDDGLSPLAAAVIARNSTGVDLLLTHGALPNARAYMNCTPLHLATCRCIDEVLLCIIRLLIMSGANVNASLDGGYTPLMTLGRGVLTKFTVVAE